MEQVSYPVSALASGHRERVPVTTGDRGQGWSGVLTGRLRKQMSIPVTVALLPSIYIAHTTTFPAMGCPSTWFTLEIPGITLLHVRAQAQSNVPPIA